MVVRNYLMRRYVLDHPTEADYITEWADLCTFADGWFAEHHMNTRGELNNIPEGAGIEIMVEWEKEDEDG